MSTSDRGRPASGQSALANWIVTLTVNVVLPFATYVLLTRVLGTSEVTALLVSGIWPALEIGYTVVKQRVVDEFSVFVLIGIVIGVATTLLSADARAVFLKDSITTGLIGAIMLVTLVVGRPLTFYLGRRFATDGSAVQRQWWNGLWQYPKFRSVQRFIGVVWGVTLLGEAVIRALLTLTVGTEPMVLINSIVPVVVIAGLVFFSIATGRRAQAAAARHGHDITPPAAAPAGAGGVVEAG
ncbi:VC0807 family protein [Pseudonocardia sp. DLS-67]